MRPRFTIALEGLRFHAAHGVYEGEAATGNGFEVDLRMEVEEQEAIVHIDQTVNYVTAFELLRGVFSEREALLETICQKAAARFETAFPQMHRLELSVRKVTPAIEHFQGSVRVAYSKSYNPKP